MAAMISANVTRRGTKKKGSVSSEKCAMPSTRRVAASSTNASENIRNRLSRVWRQNRRKNSDATSDAMATAPLSTELAMPFIEASRVQQGRAGALSFGIPDQTVKQDHHRQKGRQGAPERQVDLQE